MHKPIITTYCGLDCSLCDYKEPCQCGGCVATQGKPFHGYCDLTDLRSPVVMRDAIIERESWPVKAMTHGERLEHIWSATHDEYRGFAGDRWLPQFRGKRTVLVYGRRGGSVLKLLEELTEDEIQAKLPVHLRHLPERRAA